MTTDKAKCYPPALRAVLPDVEHRTSKYLNNGIERDHGHLKQRLYSHAWLQAGKRPPTSSFVGMPSSGICATASPTSPLRFRSIFALLRLATIGTGDLSSTPR